MGVVFQDFRLVDHLSAFDNVALPLRVSGVREADLQGPVSDMLDWVGLAHRADARPATLSGGEQQRVAIARAVIGRPDMLVADEPTGNLDQQTGEQVSDLLFDLVSEQGMTLVLVTHNQELARRCTRQHTLQAGALH
jgi:cell division transport system ATP-binding protein